MHSRYDEAKVGIFIHWGVYSVPSFGSEWFWTNWRTINSSSYIDFMRNNYKPGFTYQEFARDFTVSSSDFFNLPYNSYVFNSYVTMYVLKKVGVVLIMRQNIRMHVMFMKIPVR